MMKLLLLSACAVVVCACFACAVNAADYQIQELNIATQGTAGLGCTGWINASSGSGTLAGAVYDSGVCHAAVSDSDGHLALFGEGYALGVNSLGQSVGYAGGAAMWYAAGNLTMLPLPPNSSYSLARAISDSGLITGQCSIGTTDVRDYIVLWNGNSSPTTVGQGIGNAINDAGSIVGYTNDAGVHHAFLWNATAGMIGLAGGSASEANAINGSGQTAGMICDAGSAWACVWEADGALRLLPNLAGALSSTAWGINAAGAVVGSCDTAGGTFAVLWEQDGTLVNLGALPGNSSSVAYAISDSNLVAGCSLDSAGLPHAVAWTAVPEPTGLLVLVAGIAALLPRVRRR